VAQRYDLHSADIPSFEDDVATKVVKGLQVQISPSEQKLIQQPATTNTEAYNDYLQARYYWNEYFVHSKPDRLDKGEKAFAASDRARPQLLRRRRATSRFLRLAKSRLVGGIDRAGRRLQKRRPRGGSHSHFS
jgi:hypothetical protein